MRVIVSAGGTGGHIYPAISIINKIKEQEPNSEILYIGTHDRMERDIIPALDINYVAIEIKGFSRSLSKSNLKNLNLIRKALIKCKKIIKDFKPDVVIGVGGYVTGPVLLAAYQMKVPTFIHEQNSVPGLTNKILGKIATKVGVSFEDSTRYFDKNKVFYTGNPCGEDALSKKRIKKEVLGLDPNKKLVLMVMGSLGSKRINDKMDQILPQFKNKDYQFMYVSGHNYYEHLNQKKLPENVHVKPYINELTRVLKETDVLISRAGASTLSEIIALQVPTILIPSPHVTNNHQYKNAMDLVNSNAALLLEEQNLNGPNLLKKIDDIINNESLTKNIKTNLKAKGVLDSSTIIYNLLKDIKQ